MNNQHSQVIPHDLLAQATVKINEAAALLKPYLLTLTAEERKVMLKKGNKSDSFVNKAFEYAKTNPEFLPFFVNIADFEVDITDSDNLIGIISQTQQLCNGLDDTEMVAGSEAYYAALAYYNSVQQATNQNVPGAKTIYEELKKRFALKSRKSDTDSTAQ
jgi:hypothetical protein